MIAGRHIGRRHFFAMATALVAMAALVMLMRGSTHNTSPITFDTEDNPALQNLQAANDKYSKHLAEIDYYMRSHSIMDEGFDIVVRRREYVVNCLDSISRLTEATRRFDTPAIIFINRKFSELYSPDSQADTLSVVNDGIAKIYYPDGTYYEGQYVDTLYENCIVSKRIRHGIGVLFDHSMVRAGQWKNNVYQGEQPIYTANHIYGIDISRWQHEPSGKARAASMKTVKTRTKVKGRWVTTVKKVPTGPVSYPINWDKLRIVSLGTQSKKRVDGAIDYPISFIYIKSTEGISIRNKYYLGDYAESRKHGYRTGSYHFFSVRTAAVSQARYFLMNTRYQNGDMPPVLDVEPTPSEVNAMGGPNELLRRVRAWLELVESTLHVRPVLYVSQKFVNRYLTDEVVNGTYLRDNYHIWIARYGEYKPDVHLIYWQLSQDGRVAGIHFPVDINIFNGYEDTFQEFVKQATK